MNARLLVACFTITMMAAPLAAQNAIPGSDITLAPDSALESATRALASQLRCPVCQGLSIEDSPSELSQQMRGLVREQLRSGKSPDEVKRYFVSKYGEWILLSPPVHGVNTLVYALPLAALLCGGAFIVFVVRRWTRAASAEAQNGAP